MIAPAHTPYFVTPNGCFKMIFTAMKNGYEKDTAQKTQHILISVYELTILCNCLNLSVLKYSIILENP